MAFGLSGANGRSQMQNGDIVVAFYDRTQLRFRVEDYYMSHLAQCDGKQGVCPDERIGGKNDAVLCKFVECENYSEYLINFDMIFKWSVRERMVSLI